MSEEQPEAQVEITDEHLALVNDTTHEIVRVIPKGVRHLSIEIDMPEHISRIYLTLLRSDTE